MIEDSPVGKVGQVVVRVRGGHQPGEVRVTVAGAPETYLAYCTTGIALHRAVHIVGDRGGRGVDVEPWDWALPGQGVDGAAGQQKR